MSCSPVRIQNLVDLSALDLVFPWLDIAAIMTQTPDLGSSVFSPAVTFGSYSRSLKRSNTLPDGHLDWEKRPGAPGEADGKRNNRDWSRSINGTSLRQIDRRGSELPDSPVMREGSEATLVSPSSTSDPAARTSHEARLGDGDREGAMLGAGGDVGDYERLRQWTPNMREILAKLKTFESGSPAER